MAEYIVPNRRRRVPRRLWIVAGLVLVIIIGAIIFVRHQYYQDLKPVSNDQRTQIVTILSGSSVKQIASILAGRHLIHNAQVFEWYVHSKELYSSLQAGTYALSPSEDVPTIANTLTKGKVATKLVTILPGRRIDQVRADLINDGFSPAAADSALKPSHYQNLPALSFKPASQTSLEGLLYPDSFERTSTTDPSVIVRESLIEMGKELSPSLQAAFAKEGLSTYQGITLASIVEQEVASPTDREQVAQVFLSRLKQGMRLGSDVTANYGAIQAGKAPSLSYDSPYNTLTHKGLPPGPISTVSADSLQAVAHPAQTDWLYFVTGDNGKTYFETTLQQHQADTAKYCHKLCSVD